jgi:hypothetical protein
MAGWPHHISAVASRALERWRYLAAEGLSWSRSRQKGKGQDAVEAFTAAYRRSATELARVKAFSPDRQLADYIETAVANAHFAVYKQRRPKFRDVLRGAVFGFPALVRQYWAYHLVSILITFGCAAIAFIAVMNNPETFYLFIDRDLAGGRDPSASTEFLASGLGGRESSMDEDTGFSGMLFTHNTRVAFMCFAWGIVLGLPTIYLLIKNGLMLGSFVALYVQRGLGVFERCGVLGTFDAGVKHAGPRGCCSSFSPRPWQDTRTASDPRDRHGGPSRQPSAGEPGCGVSANRVTVHPCGTFPS